MPQQLGHGLIHLFDRHVLSRGQSELTRHSGRHEGGIPMQLGKQEQTA
jgi:hypothetical protein